MANVLKMTIVEAIHSRRSAGLSRREIARRLGIHRETVSRHLERVPDPISKPPRAAVFNRRQHTRAEFTRTSPDGLRADIEIGSRHRRPSIHAPAAAGR